MNALQHITMAEKGEEGVNFAGWNGKEILPGKELKGLRGGTEENTR